MDLLKFLCLGSCPPVSNEEDSSDLQPQYIVHPQPRKHCHRRSGSVRISPSTLNQSLPQLQERQGKHFPQRQSWGQGLSKAQKKKIKYSDEPRLHQQIKLQLAQLFAKGGQLQQKDWDLLQSLLQSVKTSQAEILMKRVCKSLIAAAARATQQAQDKAALNFAQKCNNLALGLYIECSLPLDYIRAQ